VERLSVLEETLSPFVEQRCKRFDVVKPLAAPPSARRERLPVLEETLSPFVERLSVLEETLSPFVEQRCKRFDVVKPLAAPPSARRERLPAVEETLASFAERRCKRLGDRGPLLRPHSARALSDMFLMTTRPSPPRVPATRMRMSPGGSFGTSQASLSSQLASVWLPTVTIELQTRWSLGLVSHDVRPTIVRFAKKETS